MFEVLRRLEGAGFVQRGVGGVLLAGPGAVQLALAPTGISSLHGRAEALLNMLRDETQGSARLVGDDDVVLVEAAPRRAIPYGPGFEAPITERTRLTLMLRANATRAERADAQLRFERTRISLLHYLDGDPHD